MYFHLQPNEINLIDTAGQSALHLACIQGSSQLLQYLLSIPRLMGRVCSRVLINEVLPVARVVIWYGVANGKTCFMPCFVAK